MKRLILAMVMVMLVKAQAVDWRGLNDDNYYSGQKVTAEDLVGKVVLVDEWGVNCPPCRALLPRMEALWQSFKSKPFILLGSHRQGNQPDRVAELVKANKLTYPMYNGVGLAGGEPSNGGGLPFMYVVNHRGKVVYGGRSHQEATEAIVNALGAIGGQQNLLGLYTIQKKSPYKVLEKQLVLGKSTVNAVKKLQADVKKASSKIATAVQKAQAEEAKEILAAIEEAKKDVQEEIAYQIKDDPVGALKTIKAFTASFPAEGPKYKDKLPELMERAKTAKAAKGK